jgi:ATP-dependent helicase HrpB
MAARIPLPIDPTTPKVVAALFPKVSSGPARVLLIASPGSGKTTRVPWALLSATKGKVYVLEPRRIAAKLSAERVAEENGVTIGAVVGYQFRFERKRRDDTRLVFLTEGTLLRELASNPSLKGVDVLVLDEFHERHLQADLALALAKRLQETSRPDLRILVMSATLDPVPLEKYLPGAERIEVEAPRFPIEIEYRPRESVGTFGLEKEVRRAAENLLARPDAAAFGDLLIFLPGMADIRRAESELRSAFGSRVDVLPLHGELTKDHSLDEYRREFGHDTGREHRRRCGSRAYRESLARVGTSAARNETDLPCFGDPARRPGGAHVGGPSDAALREGRFRRTGDARNSGSVAHRSCADPPRSHFARRISGI